MNEWPSSAEIDAMPLDILSLWFWQPIPAMTAEHQGILRRAAERLHQPPAVPPVYRFIEPVAEGSEPVKKTKPEPAAMVATKPKPETEPEPGGLDLFKSLFRS